LSGYASEKTQTVSFDQAINEIAKVHFDGNVMAAEADLLAPLSDSTILAFQKSGRDEPIRTEKWERSNIWQSSASGTRLVRENVYFYRSHLQDLFDNTLWKKEIEATHVELEEPEQFPVKKSKRGNKKGPYFKELLDYLRFLEKQQEGALEEKSLAQLSKMVRQRLKDETSLPKSRGGLENALKDAKEQILKR
jgi:hypothetical protein